MRILLVSSAPHAGDLFQQGLGKDRAITSVRDADTALSLAGQSTFDVVIVCEVAPDRQDMAAKLLQTLGRTIPVLFMPAMVEPHSGSTGLPIDRGRLHEGLPPSFDRLITELALGSLRGDVRILIAGDLKLDRDLRELRQGEAVVALTTKELAILELLMAAPGKVWARERIYRAIWGGQQGPATNIVDVYIRRLRKVLSPDDGPDGGLIETVKGQGYRLRS